jgi:hypothetical protein
MRPLLYAALIVVSGLTVGILAPLGGATTSTPGDGCLVVDQGFGKVTINLTRGVVFGSFQQGYLLATDQNGDAKLPIVPGVTPVKVSDHTWKYGQADNVRFRTTGGPTTLVVNALFMNLSVAGKGTATLSVTTFRPSISGRFSVDASSFCSDNFQRMPLAATKYQISSAVAG